MIFKKLFPSALLVCFALNLTLATANAQTAPERSHQVTTANNLQGDPALINNLDIIKEVSPVAVKSAEHLAGATTLRFNQMLLTAIDERLGSRYVWGATGPHVFDCSGFVWSSFNSIGINFTRGSARYLWTVFQPVGDDERYKFGTLVFFNNQTHVGIVADEKGFYHASRHNGVVYAPFDGYWGKHIDGFRRVPLSAQILAE